MNRDQFVVWAWVLISSWGLARSVLRTKRQYVALVILRAATRDDSKILISRGRVICESIRSVQQFALWVVGMFQLVIMLTHWLPEPWLAYGFFVVPLFMSLIGLAVNTELYDYFDKKLDLLLWLHEQRLRPVPIDEDLPAT